MVTDCNQNEKEEASHLERRKQERYPEMPDRSEGRRRSSSIVSELENSIQKDMDAGPNANEEYFHMVRHHGVAI
jgi:hypothetical protein